MWSIPSNADIRDCLVTWRMCLDRASWVPTGTVRTTTHRYTLTTDNVKVLYTRQCKGWPKKLAQFFWPLCGRNLEKLIWRHNSTVVRLVTTKFGRELQNDMSMTTHGLIWKPEVEFQDGGRLFPKPEVVISQQCTKIFYRNLL